MREDWKGGMSTNDVCVDNNFIAKIFDNKNIVCIFDKIFIVMKNIIGQPARGENFYSREKEVRRIEESLANKNNIQITAPRRVGKTSILWYLLDNTYSNRNYVYVDTESINDENAFYKKLLNEIIRSNAVSKQQSFWEKFRSGANKQLARVKSISIPAVGSITLNDSEAHNYLEELTNLLLGYCEEESIELVLLIDEFPITIENIRERNEEQAVSFLQGNRALRMNPDIAGKVRFIYTGSIGLNATVSKLGATAAINDLNAIPIDALDEEDALKFLQLLLEPTRRTCSENTGLHLLSAIEWYIPFHIQLIVQELITISKDGDELTPALIDRAIDNIIDLLNQHHFDHYHTRLKKQFKENAYKYAFKVLAETAEHGILEKTKAFDTAVGMQVEDSYRAILNSLEYDGYIHQNADNKSYSFNSPIVKRWWLKFFC